MYSLISQYVPEDKEDNDLPDTTEIPFEDIDRYVTIWSWWTATGKKHLISELLLEPHESMAAILQIESYYQKIMRQLRHESDGE